MNPIETPIMKAKKPRVQKTAPVLKDVDPVVDLEVDKEVKEAKKPRVQKTAPVLKDVESVVDLEVKEVKEVKARKPNPWLLYTKKISTENPDLSYKAVLSLAKASYKK
jgi:hypothetical protein